MTRTMVWQILYWAWVAGEVGVLVITRRRSGTGEARDRGSLGILWAVLIVALTAGIWYGQTHEPTMFGGAYWVRTLAIVLMACGLAIRWTAIFTLGRYFTANVSIQNSQRVVKRGIFGIVRHPSYSGLMIIFLAIAVHTRNWIAFAIVFFPCATALLYRIRVEEVALTEAFGEEYVQYCRETKRLVPGIY